MAKNATHARLSLEVFIQNSPLLDIFQAPVYTVLKET